MRPGPSPGDPELRGFNAGDPSPKWNNPPDRYRCSLPQAGSGAYINFNVCATHHRLVCPQLALSLSPYRRYDRRVLFDSRALMSKVARTCFPRSAAFRCDGRKNRGPTKQVRATRRGTIHLVVKRPCHPIVSGRGRVPRYRRCGVRDSEARGTAGRGALPGVVCATGNVETLGKGSEAVKESTKEQNNSRKDAKTQRAAKQTKEFFFALLCDFASLREIVYFFTRSPPFRRASGGAAGRCPTGSLLFGRD